MKIQTFWCDISNFGDALNLILFKKLGHIDIIKCNENFATIIGIGSLLDNILVDSHFHKSSSLPLNIFSSGFGFEEGGFFHNPDIILPEKLKRNVICWCLRGKLSQQRMENMLHEKLNIPLGDAGLLSSFLIDQNKITKKYSVGIVPHFADKNSAVFDALRKNIPNSVILDITKPPLEFIHDLCQCETVLSTAMHPLIACDALNIPNLWIRISDKTTSLYKFMDYYSVYNLSPKPFYVTDKNIHVLSKDYIQNHYSINYHDVIQIQKELRQVFKDMIIFIEKNQRRYLLDISIYKLKKIICRFISIFCPVKNFRKKIRNMYK